jgi:hypothetical protein
MKLCKTKRFQKYFAILSGTIRDFQKLSSIANLKLCFLEDDMLFQKIDDFLKSLKDTFYIFLEYLHNNRYTTHSVNENLGFLKLLVDHDTVQYDLLNFQISEKIGAVGNKPSQLMEPVGNINKVQNDVWFLEEVYF